MDKLTDCTCVAFSDKLASKDAVPGGGGASALCGALGAALGHMVGSLTVGKKKYADVEAEVLDMMQRTFALKDELVALVDLDAQGFLPLAKAYAMPKGDERDAVMEDALKSACEVPIRIMECCCKAIELHESYLEKGSRLAVSDVGAGAELCRAGLRAASLNVFINTSMMKRRDSAALLEERAGRLLDEYTRRADAVFDKVMEKLGQ